MRREKGHYRLLSRYMAKEFLLAFLVAFVFFFLIFFVNSILLLVQKILLKNITFSTMFLMVMLSMPQFLIYTFPFATLSGASMVLGDLNSSNELMALRSSGIPLSRVFLPILVLSLALSFCTFLVSDYLLPWSNIQYKERLTLLMRDMPTFELESNGVNTVSNVLVANGPVEGNTIENLVMITTDRSDSNMSIASGSGSLEMIDVSNFVYRLDIEDASILLSDSSDSTTFVEAEGDHAYFYLDFSSQVPSLTSTDPVNLSSHELRESIEKRKPIEMADRTMYYEDLEDSRLKIASELRASYSSGTKDSAGYRIAVSDLEDKYDPPVDFYSQYYKAELTKKYALSLACFFLTLIALPLGLLKLKYGKLTGFAVSLLVAVAYWYMLFYAQLEIFEITGPPYLLIFAPNLVVGLAGLVLLFIMRKAR